MRAPPTPTTHTAYRGQHIQTQKRTDDHDQDCNLNKRSFCVRPADHITHHLHHHCDQFITG
jgi:hypothetical protein